MIPSPAVLPTPAILALGMAALALVVALTLRRTRRVGQPEAALPKIAAHGHYCPGCDREWGHPGQTCLQHWSWPCEDCRAGMRAPLSIRRTA